MDPAALVALIGAGLALAGSPGPNTMSLAATGAAFGARQGFVYMLGIDAGMLVVMALVATGTVGVLLAIPGATPVAAILAVGYFLYLAWRIATAPALGAVGAERRPPSWHDGVLLSLVNPKGYVAMLALFSGHRVLKGLAADAGLKIAVLMAIIVGVNIVWLMAGGGLARLFRNPSTSRILNLVFAALLLASAIALLPR